ncbi:MAG: UDP-N-acetylmuramoyl-tripeptide--D-alanyl-D-alanine ligase [Lachnospiraceae bacterium]
MKNLTLEHITDCCHGTYIGTEEQQGFEVTGVVIDSRKVEAGNLFVAIKGERVDGHTFIDAVYEQGAAAVVSQQRLENPKGPYILVDSTTQALKDIAAFYRNSLDIKVVGITGSVGKTSTKEMIASVLSEKYRVLKTAGNFNNEIGLPLTIFRLSEEEGCVFLAGNFGFNEMPFGVIRNDICDRHRLCHLENLGSRDGILKAKTEIFEHLNGTGTVILNGEDDRLSTVENVNGKVPVFYGKSEKNQCGKENCIYATEIRNLGLDGMKAVFHFPECTKEVEIPIPGEHNVLNALAGACVGMELGLDVEQICAGIKKAQTIGGRTNLIHANDMLIIDDCYNANPVSMRASIDVLTQAKGRMIAVLGDMGELGADEKRLHYEVGAYAASRGLDALFCCGELSKELAKGAEEHSETMEIFYFATKEELLLHLKSYLKKGDTILVKASHFMEFPDIVRSLQASVQ